MHKELMLLALAQAKLGRGLCAPNPAVGALLLEDGQMIAQAHHRGAGLPHAEQLVLEGLIPSRAARTLYVTLEPCNHWGRTPPCVDAIIAHGVQRVVYAYNDPNPKIAALNTPSLLRAKGVEVIHYPLAEIDAFYQSYAYWLRTQRPWVSVKIAQSLDAKITGADSSPLQISNQACHALTHQLRGQSDVILSTSRTLRQDNPKLTVRLPDCPDLAKPLAILDRCLEMKPGVQALDLAKKVHLFYDESVDLLEPQPDWHYLPVSAKGFNLDLNAILGHLGRMGYHDLWVEAVAKLFNELHKQSLVNRTYVYVAPKMIGHQGLSFSPEPLSFDTAQHCQWQIMADNAVLTLDW